MMENETLKKLMNLLNEEIIPFSVQDSSSYESLIDKIGEARIVLMGEASHGTEEFYQARIELTKQLILKKNFHAVAIEGDWTSTYPVHYYLQGHGKASDSHAALSDFSRFPGWMWRNTTMPPFLAWLRNHNDNLKDSRQKVGFYGLDLYCLNASMQAVINFLTKTDPEAAQRASERYACFDHTAADPQLYGYLIESRYKKACIKEVSEQLLEMHHVVFNQIQSADLEKEELLFYAMQNARLVKNAEHYYRAMFESREETWNIRDQHMGETLQNLISHVETRLNTPAKIIIWAHNSHIGDARATEMSTRGEINLGQIVREHFGLSSFHLGFSTHSGTVTAANDWDAPAETKNVLPALPGSYELLFHELQHKNFILFLHGGESIDHMLTSPKLQRAIGVIYRPETERHSHYFFSHLPYQFDALIHLDQTTAVKPLD